jgi:predicted RNA binding protein YcfA (HicA-like mRNA interferase family)
MLTFPAVSAEDCIRALQIAGFRAIWQLNGHTLLVSADRLVTVPHVRAIDSEMVDAIVQSSNLSLAHLYGLVALTGSEKGLNSDFSHLADFEDEPSSVTVEPLRR